MGGLAANLAPQTAQIRAQSGQQLTQVPGKMSSILDPAINRGQGAAQFETDFPLRYMSGLGSLISGTPLYQPTYSPGKGENLMSFAGPILANANYGNKGGGATPSTNYNQGIWV